VPDGSHEVASYQRVGKRVLAAPDLEPVAFEYLARTSSLTQPLPLNRELRERELKLLGAGIKSVEITLPHFTFPFSR
jgi:hypothetical protein